MKKVNILLDLDQTVISGEYTSDVDVKVDNMKGLKYSEMDNEYVIFQRPGLQRFLDFLFANFNVSVWTAASKLYATFIIKNIILKKSNRKLNYILFMYHTEISNSFGRGLKDLSLLKTLFKFKNFHKNNTFILDDNDDVKETNGPNCFAVKPFEYFKYGLDADEKKEDDVYLIDLERKLREKFL